ncbi:MAG: hypothetical protein JJE18_04590 [Eubacteriaceae bacterium]|nr:hypothetical protein [Eubacteriaceae bacterium]
MSVKDTSNVAELLKRMDELRNKTIEVGILSDAGGEIIDRATWNEFGTKNIPERSFIRAGYDTNKSKIESQGEKLVNSVVNMAITPNRAAETLGEVAKGMIQDFAVNLSDPPNAESTIRQKGSDNPLVDTGEMIEKINYKVKG